MQSRVCKTCNVELERKQGVVRFVYDKTAFETTGPIFSCPECECSYVDFYVIFLPNEGRGNVDARINQEVRGNA